MHVSSSNILACLLLVLVLAGLPVLNSYIAVWTSPIISNSGHKYYLMILDDFSHYSWVFPLKSKSDVHLTIVHFHTYVLTQFGTPIKAFQADNGTEFINSATTSFLATHGVLPCLSCPYTSPQNGKAERMLHTLNNATRTLLFHAYMHASFWVEALSTACLLLNRLPSSTTLNTTPYTLLYDRSPSYDHL